MVSGQNELQIFLSVVVILMAAAVALICDFLKVNNDRLRDLVIELTARREAEETVPQTDAAEPVRPIPRTQAQPVEHPVRRSPKTASLPAAVPSVSAPAASPPAANPAAQLQPPQPALKIEAKTDARVRLSQKDWKALLEQSGTQMVSPGSRPRRVQKTIQTAPAGGALPTGFHPQATLTRLVAEQQRVSGLAVAIGVAGARQPDGSIPDAVLKFIQSLPGAGDFACASGPEEFLLISPAERGAAAQRRLNQIAQQLWDFQLRSPESAPGLFSWGGTEVNNEPIEEALAMAAERMHETQRTRKPSGSERVSIQPKRMRRAV